MSLALSDYNPASPSRVARKFLYSDLDLGFAIDASVGIIDVVPVTDIDAVKNSVKNLVLSNFHDRPFQPYLASNVRALLFENADPFTALAIKQHIIQVLKDFEPRVNQVAVSVTDNSDTNEYQVTISFNVIAINLPGTVNFYLTRLR